MDYSSILGGGGGGGGSGMSESSSASATSGGYNFGSEAGGASPILVLGLVALAVFGLLGLILIARK